MITVLLVRHAEIDLPRRSPDPPLNAAGRKRADLLVHVCSAAGVTSLFTSAFRRSRQTAAPLADRLGLQPRDTPAAADLADQLLSEAFGEVALMVGHSDTIPPLMAALGVPAPLPVISERAFDNLFVVTAAKPADAHLVSLKYGEATG